MSSSSSSLGTNNGKEFRSSSSSSDDEEEEPPWAAEAYALMAPQTTDLRLDSRVVTLRTAGGAFGARWAGSPGSSSWLLEDVAPYSRGAQSTLLDPTSTSKANSMERVHEYAELALARALTIETAQRGLGQLRAHISEEAERRNDGRGVVLGVGCSASLGTSNERDGRENHAWVASVGADGRRETRHIGFTCGSRRLQDCAVGAAVAEACGDAQGAQCLAVFKKHGALAYDTIDCETEVTPLLPAHRELILQPAPLGETPCVLYLPRAAAEAQTGAIAVVPGSFNPIHEAHSAMATLSKEALGDCTVLLELTLSNADKGGLGVTEVLKRLKRNCERMRGNSSWPTLVTNATLLVDKAALFPRARAVRFCVGFDTASRVLDPKYYEGEDGLRDCLLALADEHRAKFFVAGRDETAGKNASEATRYLCADDLPVVDLRDGKRTSREIFTSLPGWQRRDLSSSAIRKQEEEEEAARRKEKEAAAAPS